jgi:hypothetical protein
MCAGLAAAAAVLALSCVHAGGFVCCWLARLRCFLGRVGGLASGRLLSVFFGCCCSCCAVLSAAPGGWQVMTVQVAGSAAQGAAA